MTLYNDDICVICGKYVPEGQMVCASCKRNNSVEHISIVDFLFTRKLGNRKNGGEHNAKL